LQHSNNNVIAYDQCKIRLENLMGTSHDEAFWTAIDNLVRKARIVIDRPKGTHHPRFSSLVYPLDYGYLENTTSMDGHGIDIWQGSIVPATVEALICTIDLLKRDSEVKILFGCNEAEMRLVCDFHNQGEQMKGILIRRLPAL
jgi:inorganic pyrophosphatase